MKVLDVESFSGECVETDNEEWPDYFRYSSDNWERRYGESTEPVYDCKDIEVAYQKFKAKK